MRTTHSIHIVIPVYNPPDLFWTFFRRLRTSVRGHILIVNDGSDSGFSRQFDRLSAYANTTVITHDRNRGKGAALKTAMSYLRKNHPGTHGILTVDADGQHETDDIASCLSLARKEKHTFIIGTRLPRTMMPIRSRTGNALTRMFLYLLHGRFVRDTQSGLRYIPISLMELCEISVFDKYDFELDMIILALRGNIPVRQIPMRPIYINRNKSSHFRTASDSWYVAKVFWHRLRHPISRPQAS